MEVRVNNSKAKIAIDRAINVDKEINSLLGLVARTFQQEVKENITEQGKRYGTWAPASKWTIAKAGNSKLFSGTMSRVRVRNAPGRSSVVFDSPGEWTLTQHHHGFTVPPTGGLVTLHLKNPAALGVQNEKFSFISRRASKVPARRMWPTEAGARGTAETLIAKWAKVIEAGLTA